MAITRIKKELQDIKNNTFSNISARPMGVDFFHWWGIIIGPDKTPYENGLFKLTIIFPTDYPSKPPTITFKTPIYHPNISLNGNVSLGILDKKWNSELTISKVLSSVSDLLREPDKNCSVPSEILQQFKNNKIAFKKKAKEWTIQYAM
jgi:ubiquitin-conjugating enzyme E2 D/E